MPDEVPPLSRQYWLAAPMMRGDEVWDAQRKLVQYGAAIRADGVFGAATRDAVIRFQQRIGLKPDGVLGPLTWRALHGTTKGDNYELKATDFLTAEARARLAREHSRYPDGVRWSIGKGGLAVQGEKPSTQPGDRKLVARVFETYFEQIRAASARYPAPVELVVATICTESSGMPRAIRREPGCDTANPDNTPARVSMGLMQTLLSTARDVLGNPTLRIADLENPATSINAGMAYIWRQARQTSLDPPLVAAAYNAGSVRHNSGPQNRWKLTQYPIGTAAHVDRFVRFFNAAWEDVLARPPPQEPAVSFALLFQDPARADAA